MHTTFNRLRKRVRSIVIAATASSMVLGNIASVGAQTLNTASLELSDPRTGQTNVTYTFDAANFNTGTAIECMQLELATTSAGGTAVTGIDTTGASFDASGTLVTETNWTEDFGTNGLLELTYATGETPAGNGTLVFTGIDNGSTDETTYFAILTTFSDDTCTTQVDDVVIAFIYADGQLVELTIDATLNFVVSGVAASALVNGATTTHLSDASGINYANDVTSSTNGVSAHDVAVTTNASNGYVVYIRHTGQLTNGASDTIDNHTGTNGTPSAFPAAGTESWGYTTEDATLNPTADRFTTGGGDLWAGFTTTNQEVLYNAAAVPGTETVRVGHQVGVASTTEAGTYQTTIVYTVVATF